MVRKTRRKIGRKTARNLLTWGHYRFRQILIDKAREYPWVNNIFVTNEAYTTKTCTYCGWMNENIGGKKVYTCHGECGGKKFPRDFNGARNILLRFLGVMSRWMNNNNFNNNNFNNNNNNNNNFNNNNNNNFNNNNNNNCH